MKITTRKINDYTTEVTIDDKKIIITDRKKSNLVKRVEHITSKIGKSIGCMITALAGVKMLGIAGHMDYIAEFIVSDGWTSYEYGFKIISSIIMIIIGYILYVKSDFDS